MLKGFKQFILRGNVVDLAIAVVIGVAFNALVQAFIHDLITPLVAAIFGKPNFATLSFTLHHSKFLYGDVINYVISFVLIATVLYFAVVAPLNSIAQRRQAQSEPQVSDEVKLLSEIRDLLAQRSGGSS